MPSASIYARAVRLIIAETVVYACIEKEDVHTVELRMSNKKYALDRTLNRHYIRHRPPLV